MNTGSARAVDIELPALGDASSAVVSPQAERKLGEAWLRMFRSQVRTVSDPLLTDYLEHVVFDLAEHSQLSDAQLKLVVVENPTINAFAVPGGVMGIHNGLLLSARHEDEMASVIAHELAHLSQRRSPALLSGCSSWFCPNRRCRYRQSSNGAIQARS